MANITTASSHADQARSGPHRCYACGQFAGAGHECPTMDRAHLSTTGALVPSPTAQDADPKTPAPMVPADADVPHRGDVRSARVAAGLAALRYRRTGDRGPLQEALAARRAAVVGEAHPDTGEASAQEAEAPGGPGWCAQCGQFSGQGHSCPQPPGLPSADYAGMSGEARVKAMLGDLTASVQAVVASGQLQRWLDGMASNGMNRWSANNRLLAMVQMVQRGEPVEDLHLMGFRQWEGHGRHVRKGARAVWILAPMTRKVEEEADDGTTTLKQRVVGFKGVPVFNVSDTEGEPLPAPPIRALEGEATPGTIEGLTTHYYGLSGAPTATVLSGGGAGGSYRLRYKSTANGQSVYETTRAMLGHTSDFSIVARGRARGLPGIEAGTFYMQLWSRWVEYPHNNALACTPNQYTRAGILNPNGAPVNVGAMTKRQEGHPQFLSSSAWVSSVSGSWWNPTPAIEDAQDIQWRAVASAYDSSAQRMQVDLDNLYVEVSG